jgi:SlyX protein
MSDIKTLSDRIDTLETRLMFQDEAIEALTRQLVNLNERLQEAETQVPGAANEPPPHY